jgi:hypothetical protein
MLYLIAAKLQGMMTWSFCQALVSPATSSFKAFRVGYECELRM